MRARARDQSGNPSIQQRVTRTWKALWPFGRIEVTTRGLSTFDSSTLMVEGIRLTDRERAIYNVLYVCFSDGENEETMPKVKLISDEKIKVLRDLRKQGLAIRVISQLTNTPRATVHQYVRDEAVRGTALLLSDSNEDVHQLGIHLPFNLACPRCDLEQSHIVLCVDCGAIWMGECGHGGEVAENRHQGVDLAALEKHPGDTHLYVYALETEDYDASLARGLATQNKDKVELSEAAIERMAAKVADIVVERLKGS